MVGVLVSYENWFLFAHVHASMKFVTWISGMVRHLFFTDARNLRNYMSPNTTDSDDNNTLYLPNPLHHGWVLNCVVSERRMLSIAYLHADLTTYSV